MPYKDLTKLRAFQRNWQRKQIIKNKERAVELLGGKCQKCGYADNIVALQIDHIKPLKRKRAGGSANSSLVVRGRIKLDEVQLLCANCHAIKTYEDRKQFSRYKGS